MYIFAADESGRRECHPYIGAPDPHKFTLVGDTLVISKTNILEINIYPNPTTGELRITNYELEITNYKLGINRVEFFDVYGRNRLSHKPPISSETTINIAYLPAGIYFVRITTEAGVAMRKVVKY